MGLAAAGEDPVTSSMRLDPNQPSNTRIFVGGLGASVTASDFESTFSSLGRVFGVEIVRTNGRSFAYMDFEPLSDKHLSKLFSSYNGCMWKGGRLKVEKAKEHYLARLQREWSMDAAQSSARDVAWSVTTAAEADVNNASKSPGKRAHMMPETSGLRIFFPRSKKVKVLPSKGTGKHKYSFERVESLPLPLLHVCGCEEHNGHPEMDESNKVALDVDKSMLETGGICDKERDIMKRVMEKLIGKEDHMQAATDHGSKIPQPIDMERFEKWESSKARVDWKEPEVPDDTEVLNENEAEIDSRNGRTSGESIETAVGKMTPKSVGKKFEGRETTSEEINFKKEMKILPNNANAFPMNVDAKGEAEVVNSEEKKSLRVDSGICSSIQHKDAGGNSNIKVGLEIKCNVDSKVDDRSGALHVPDNGRCWVQKASWKDLVGETGQVSFSLSSILGGVSPAEDSKDSKRHAAVGHYSLKHSSERVKGKALAMSGKNAGQVEGPRGSSDEGLHSFLTSQVMRNTGSESQEKKSEPIAEMQILGDAIEREEGSKENSTEMQSQDKEGSVQLNRNLHLYRQDTGSAEACTFMRSANAEDEWLKSKAAVRGYAKARRKMALKTLKTLGTAPMGRF